MQRLTLISVVNSQVGLVTRANALNDLVQVTDQYCLFDTYSKINDKETQEKFFKAFLIQNNFSLNFEITQFENNEERSSENVEFHETTKLHQNATFEKWEESQCLEMVMDGSITFYGHGSLITHYITPSAIPLIEVEYRTSLIGEQEGKILVYAPFCEKQYQAIDKERWGITDFSEDFDNEWWFAEFPLTEMRKAWEFAQRVELIPTEKSEWVGDLSDEIKRNNNRWTKLNID